MPDDDHTERTPIAVAQEQTADAVLAMDRELDEYARLPFTALDELVGQIPPGDVGFICGFSGQGKTTLVSSMVQRITDSGKCAYVVPLESEPHIFRTHLACKALKLHAGKVLTGVYKRELPADEWRMLRLRIRDAILTQSHGLMLERLFVSPTRRMDVKTLEQNARHAAEVGADFFIIDHIDHIAGGEGRNPHAESALVVDRVLDLTQHYGLATICTSQLNNEAVKNDPLGQYQCPRPHHVYMGGKKRQNAAWMLGIFRPLRLSGTDRDEMAAVRNGAAEAWKLLEPNCMAAALMKSRHFGEREGHRTYLEVRDGIVSDFDSASLQMLKAGVSTTSRSFMSTLNHR
jgi:KaiC/GvpD/RAD55 family RecA-like ATPase